MDIQNIRHKPQQIRSYIKTKELILLLRNEIAKKNKQIKLKEKHRGECVRGRVYE